MEGIFLATIFPSKLNCSCITSNLMKEARENEGREQKEIPVVNLIAPGKG